MANKNYLLKFKMIIDSVDIVKSTIAVQVELANRQRHSFCRFTRGNGHNILLSNGEKLGS
jgi:hypothetical protein